MKTLSGLLLGILLAGCVAVGEYRILRQPDFDRVQEGMTRDDTLRLLGKPVERMPFPLSGNEAWDYYFTDPWGYYCRFSITFGPKGAVVSKISQRLNDGGNHGASK